MKFDANVNIHNEFTIEVRDARTGELKQEVKAYNIVLDALFSRLVNRQGFFEHIFFGTGTGVLDAARTSLFSRLGYKPAEDYQSSRAFPVSYRTRKIVLAPEEYVGQTITEVGIAYGTSTSNAVTHALLKDAAGNTISITKTAEDVITIYAKMYYELGEINGMYGGKVWWSEASQNYLLTYLMGGSFPSALYYRLGQCDQPHGLAELGASPAITWTVDAANKKMITNAARFDVNTGNGPARAVWLGDPTNYLNAAGIFEAYCPVPGVHDSHAFSGKQIGIGDGVKTEFSLPWDEAIAITAVRVDGVEVTPAEVHLSRARGGFRMMRPANPPSGTNSSFDVAWSPDGKYVALATAYNPYFMVWENVDGALVRMPLPDIAPPGQGQAVAWSPDGQYVAFGGQGNALLLYRNNSGSMTRLALPDIAPTAAPYGLAWSPDGRYLAVVGTFMQVYENVNGQLVKQTSPASVPSATYGVAWSPDGQYVAVSSNVTGYFVTIYSHSNGQLTRLADPASQPGSGCYDVAWSPDGLLLAVGSAAAPGVFVYQHNAGVLTLVNNSISSIGGTGQGVAWSPDGQMLIACCPTAPSVFAYRHANGVLTALPTVVGLVQSSAANAVKWSPDGKYLAGAGYAFDGLFLFAGFRIGPSYNIKFASPPANGAIITGDWTIGYIPKDNDHVFDAQAAISFGTPS